MRSGLPASMVSAVICTRNRAERLRRTLESLCRQTLAAEAFEVVVVDDGSSDATPEVVGRFEARLRLRYSRQRRAGAASARNHGLLCARGLVLVFIDDDLADPELLERHLAAHRRFPDPSCAVVGRARLDASVAADPLMRFAAEAGWPPFDPLPPPAGEPLDFRHVAAGRTSWKRSFLLDFAAFDPTLRSGGEGPDLALRLAPRGLEVVLEPDATTVITERLTVDEACARAERDGRVRRRIADRHDDPAVQRWAGVAGAAKAWSATAAAYGTMLRSARDLDRLARVCLDERLPLDELERALLQRSYGAALRASRLKGVAESARLVPA